MVSLWLSFEQIMMHPSPKCYILSFVLFRRRYLKGVYHILVLRLSWSCDPGATSKLFFLLPIEAPHKIWFWLAKRSQRRRCLNIVDDDGGRATDGWTPVHVYTVSSPMSLRHRWSKKHWLSMVQEEQRLKRKKTHTVKRCGFYAMLTGQVKDGEPQRLSQRMRTYEKNI